jgi:hypothetical protein
MLKALKVWLKRLRCPHDEGWETLHIAWDGDVIVRCGKCGKRITIPLSKP